MILFLRLLVSALCLSNLLLGAIEPVALSAMSDGTILVLTRDNGLYVTDPGGSSVKKTAQLPSGRQPMDLACAGRRSDSLMFVVAKDKSWPTPRVARYDVGGKELGQWKLSSGSPVGVAFDPVKRSLYITESQGAAVYTATLSDKPGATRYLSQVTGAGKLGSIAVDPATGQIFIADVFSGSIQRLVAPSYKSSVLVKGLGTPSALALGQGGRVLYVADSALRCVWSVRLDAAVATATRFWNSGNLKSPMALAVSSTGVIWIGDPVAKALFGITPAGVQSKVLR